MLNKNLILGSVASLAVAVALGPAFAQSPPQYPDYSLPWEAAETQQLNAQQASEPGIITSNTTASVSTPSTAGVVASTDNSEDVVAYNQALANSQNDQSQFNSQQSQYNSELNDYNAKQSTFQQSWQDYQNKLSNYNQQMSAPASATIVSPGAAVVSEQIINRPSVQQQVVQESFTRPVVREQMVTRPVVRERTVMQPRTVWEPVKQRYVENETVTQRVVTNETVTRPVVREQVVNRPVVREVIERPLGETVVATNTVPASDEWVTIYPHHERLVVFQTVSNPDVALRGTPVMDRSGNMVGTFQHMTLQDSGRPEALITLSDNKTVAVADQHLRFDPMARVVVADLSFGQMDSMPARF
jgi:hypothetical protein